MQKTNDFFKALRSEKLKTMAMSIVVTSTVVFSIFYFDIHIDTLIEFAGPIHIETTTTINFNS